jgi:hypothetical protein
MHHPQTSFPVNNLGMRQEYSRRSVHLICKIENSRISACVNFSRALAIAVHVDCKMGA